MNNQRWVVCLGIVVFALLDTGHAGPDDHGKKAFEAAAHAKGCAAIPYDGLRSECVAKEKAAKAACQKVRACDGNDPELMPELQTIRQDRKQIDQTDADVTQTRHDESTEGQKPDNSDKVHELQAKERTLSNKAHELQDKEEADEDKLGDTLGKHKDADADCLAADKEAIDVYAEALAQVEGEDDDALQALADQVAKQLYDTVRAAQPASDVRKDLEQCTWAWRNKAAFIDKKFLKGLEDDCKDFFGPTQSGTPERKEQLWCLRKSTGGNKFMTKDQWMAAYDTIVTNAKTGGAFEQKALKHGIPDRPMHKNTYPMMKNPGATCGSGESTDHLDSGFIPDGVKGVHVDAPLDWGRAYDFVEVKNVKKMDYTKNLKAMMEYVALCGGSITIIFRGETAMKPQTKLGGELDKRLEYLKAAGRAEVYYYSAAP